MPEIFPSSQKTKNLISIDGVPPTIMKQEAVRGFTPEVVANQSGEIALTPTVEQYRLSVAQAVRTVFDNSPYMIDSYGEAIDLDAGHKEQFIALVTSSLTDEMTALPGFDMSTTGLALTADVQQKDQVTNFSTLQVYGTLPEETALQMTEHFAVNYEEGLFAHISHEWLREFYETLLLFLENN